MPALTKEQSTILAPLVAGMTDEDKISIESAVLAASEANGSRVLGDVIGGQQRRERIAWALALAGLLIGGVGIGAGFAGISNSETHAYLALVDRDTGTVSRAVTVERAAVEHSDAIRESLIHAYVFDREAYDPDDNEYRIRNVALRTAGQALTDLSAIWQPGHSQFPPDLYGDDGVVQVRINNIEIIDEDTARVRFTKRHSRSGKPVREGDFISIVTYRFQPDIVNNNQILWANPYGFQVTGYRRTSEGSGS